MISPLYNRTTSQKALTSVARTNGTVNGDTVDRGSENVSVLFVILTATLTDGVHTINVQESDDNSTFTDATVGALGQQGANVVTAITNDDTYFDLGYNGSKRYCRLKVVTSGATTGGVLGAVAIKEGGRHPVTR